MLADAHDSMHKAATSLGFEFREKFVLSIDTASTLPISTAPHEREARL
jgi:hypothetical protein